MQAKKPEKVGHKQLSSLYALETWDVPGSDHPHTIMNTPDSVNVLIYNCETRCVILVEQTRPAMIRDDNPAGRIVEAVAGRFDAGQNPKQLMIQEAWEEAGVRLEEEDIIMLNQGVPAATTGGQSSERAFLGFAEITSGQIEIESDRGHGLADEGEHITRIRMDLGDFLSTPAQDIRVMVFQHFLQHHLKPYGRYDF